MCTKSRPPKDGINLTTCVCNFYVTTRCLMALVAPMDLVTDAFATSRRSLIEQRLQQIRSQSMPKLLAEAWTHYGSLLLTRKFNVPPSLRSLALIGTQCLGVDWRYSLQHLQVVASCISGCALVHSPCALASRGAHTHTHTPDWLRGALL